MILSLLFIKDSTPNWTVSYFFSILLLMVISAYLGYLQRFGRYAEYKVVFSYKTIKYAISYIGLLVHNYKGK